MKPSRNVCRVAIVGCGAISRAHAAAIAETEGLELVAVADSNPEAVRRAENDLEVEGFDSVPALLQGTRIDSACVCTPPATHCELTEGLLGAGVNVLCEKPLAVRAADARAMVATAEREDRRLAVSDKFRHVADLEMAGERIRAGEIGRPVSYAVTFCAPVDVQDRWPSDPSMSGGGVLMDNGPHAFDVLSHVLDEPIVAVSAWLAEPVLAPPVEDTAIVLFSTGAGAVGRIELSWVYFTKDLDYLVVHGTEGTIRVGWTGGCLRRHGERDWSEFGVGYDKHAAFRGMWRTFGNGTSPSRAPFPEEAVALIEEAYDTARVGRPKRDAGL